MLQPVLPILAHRRNRSRKDRHRSNKLLKKTYSQPWSLRGQTTPALSTSRATIFCYHRSMKGRSASSSERSPSICAKWYLTSTVMIACLTLTRSRVVCGRAGRNVQPSKCRRWPTVAGMTPSRAQHSTLAASPCRAREIAPGGPRMGFPTGIWSTRWRPFTTSADQETTANWYGTPRGKPRGPASSLNSRDWQVIRMRLTLLGLSP